MKFSHLSRVYTTEPIRKNQPLVVAGENFYYLKSVMRLRHSETFRLFNAIDGEFLVRITEIAKSNLVVMPESLLRVPNTEQNLTLAMCIIKPDRMLEVIKPAVQLGVTKIIPVISSRSQYKNIAFDRAIKCIIGSTEQSERFKPAELLEPISLIDFCKKDDFEQIIFACETETEDNKIKNINKIEDNPVIIIGPEGGFTPEEITMIKSLKNVHSISLGKSVLKAETAAITALACTIMMRN